MLRIGLDLDNTLIRYDQAFLAAAKKRDLVPTSFTGDKRAVCAHIRAHEDEKAWQTLQGYVYGAGMEAAELYEGVLDFLSRAHALGVQLYIVSHKTEFGHYDPAQVNLREAALAFLEQQGVLAFVTRAQVFFYATRAEKVSKIAQLGCDVFVDDLEEVFLEPHFPAGIRKLLFAPHRGEGTWELKRSWREIEEAVFDTDLRASA